MVTKTDFGGCALYVIEAGELRAAVTDLGAAVVSLRFRGRETVLGYDSPEGYRRGAGYVGAAIGRFANRIAGAAFVLGGRRFVLSANEGENTLHGGADSFDKRRWTAEPLEDAVRFTLLSPDGDNGFPGTLRAAVTYRVSGDTLQIDFEGDSDADTVYAPTSHLYFDLGGGDALSARLRLNASRYLEVDGALIPTRAAPAGGDFDFSVLRPVGRDYDHCFLLDGEEACTLEQAGLRLEIRTDFPAIQVYTGGFLDAPFAPRQGIALEPEFYPDSPNRPDFPDTTLRAGEHFRRRAAYRFSEV